MTVAAAGAGRLAAGDEARLAVAVGELGGGAGVEVQPGVGLGEGGPPAERESE